MSMMDGLIAGQVFGMTLEAARDADAIRAYSQQVQELMALNRNLGAWNERLKADTEMWAGKYALAFMAKTAAIMTIDAIGAMAPAEKAKMTHERIEALRKSYFEAVKRENPDLLAAWENWEQRQASHNLFPNVP